MPSFLNNLSAAVVVLAIILISITTTAFQPHHHCASPSQQWNKKPCSSPLCMSTGTETTSPKSGYVPKWKKKQTLADELGDLDFKDKGIKGTVSVIFKQGNATKTTMAMPGQPLRDVATQAGQFIKYGCGKGECGTCECMVNGKWIRPCTGVVPTDNDGEVVVQVKEVASATTSSGQFFSVKSFFMGFYNNVLGMVGFVKYRRNAKKNWEERVEYEDLIRQKTMEIKQRRQAEYAAKAKMQQKDQLSP